METFLEFRREGLKSSEFESRQNKYINWTFSYVQLNIPI